MGLAGVLMAVIHLVSCTLTALPGSSERTAVGAGEKAIVLIRVECAIENQQPYEPFSHSLMDDNISFGLGDFNTGGEPRRIGLTRFLSPESRREGWTYFVLPPGTYYLSVYPPRRTDAFSYMSSLKNAPRWRMDVPEKAKLVYAGTLRVTGESDWLVFGGRIMRSFHSVEVSVATDQDVAHKLLAEHFRELGETQSVSLQRQEGPIILHAPLPAPVK